MPRLVVSASQGGSNSRGEGKTHASSSKDRGNSAHGREKGIKEKKEKVGFGLKLGKEKGKDKGSSSNLSIKSSVSSVNAASSTNSIAGAKASLSTGATWTPPLWLTKEKHPPRPRSLTIPIPPVQLATKKAIQKQIAAQQPPYFKQQAHVQQLQNKLKGHKEKVKNAQQKLGKLEESRAERIQEIKVLREEELETKLRKISEEMHKDHDVVLKEQEEEWQQQTEKEMKAAKRQFKKEQAEMDELERESHKQHMEEEQQKKDQGKIEQKASVEDGEVDDDQDPAEEGEDADNKDLLPSQELDKDHKKVKENLDNLKETKKEMVWLLKQVINAEKKRKASETIIPKKKEIKRF